MSETSKQAHPRDYRKLAAALLLTFGLLSALGFGIALGGGDFIMRRLGGFVGSVIGGCLLAGLVALAVRRLRPLVFPVGIAVGLMAFWVDSAREINLQQGGGGSLGGDIASAVSSLGLEETLARIVKGITVPTTVDEVTTLVRAEADGSTLRYVYAVDVDTPFMTNEVRSYIISLACGSEQLSPIMRAGGVLEYLYETPEGAQIATVVIKDGDCG